MKFNLLKDLSQDLYVTSFPYPTTADITNQSLCSFLNLVTILEFFFLYLNFLLLPSLPLLLLFLFFLLLAILFFFIFIF